MTKKINMFNHTKRKIRCIANEHDYLGDGTIFYEKELEVGKLYHVVKFEMMSYGNMVYLEEVSSKYGFQSYLFEELEEHDAKLLEDNYAQWLENKLAEGLEDIEQGRTAPAEEVFRKLEEKYSLKVKHNRQNCYNK